MLWSIGEWTDLNQVVMFRHHLLRIGSTKSHRVNGFCVSTIVNSYSTTVLDLPFPAFTLCSLIKYRYLPDGVETML